MGWDKLTEIREILRPGSVRGGLAGVLADTEGVIAPLKLYPPHLRSLSSD